MSVGSRVGRIADGEDEEGREGGGGGGGGRRVLVAHWSTKECGVWYGRCCHDNLVDSTGVADE